MNGCGSSLRHNAVAGPYQGDANQLGEKKRFPITKAGEYTVNGGEQCADGDQPVSQHTASAI